MFGQKQGPQGPQGMLDYMLWWRQRTYQFSLTFQLPQVKASSSSVARLQHDGPYFTLYHSISIHINVLDSKQHLLEQDFRWSSILFFCLNHLYIWNVSETSFITDVWAAWGDLWQFVFKCACWVASGCWRLRFYRGGISTATSTQPSSTFSQRCQMCRGTGRELSLESLGSVPVVPCIWWLQSPRIGWNETNHPQMETQ